MDTIAAFFITMGLVSAAHVESAPPAEQTTTAVEQQAEPTAHRSEAVQRWLKRRAELDQRRIRMTNDWLRQIRRARFATADEPDSRS